MLCKKIDKKYRPFVGLTYRYPSGCFWLVQDIYEKLYNIELPDYSQNGDMNDREVRSAVFLRSLANDWVEVTDPSEGDIVILNFYGKPQHIGVVVADGYMLHSFDERDSGIDSYKDIKYSSRIEGFYRYAPNKQRTSEE